MSVWGALPLCNFSFTDHFSHVRSCLLQDPDGISTPKILLISNDHLWHSRLFFSYWLSWFTVFARTQLSALERLTLSLAVSVTTLRIRLSLEFVGVASVLVQMSNLSNEETPRYLLFLLTRRKDHWLQLYQILIAFLPHIRISRLIFHPWYSLEIASSFINYFDISEFANIIKYLCSWEFSRNLPVQMIQLLWPYLVSIYDDMSG